MYCKKSDLVKCLNLTAMGIDKPKGFDCKIIDAAVSVHISKPNAVETLQEYAETVFVKFIQHELQSLNIVDVVLDHYLASRIKGSAREKH